MTPKKRQRSRNPVIQTHHINYKEKHGRDWTVPIYKGEHQILTLLSWRKNISQGLIVALCDYIENHAQTAHCLGPELIDGENVPNRILTAYKIKLEQTCPKQDTSGNESSQGA